MSRTKKMTLLSILIAQALCLHVIESAIPLPIAVPGIKLGLANVVSLFTIVVFGFREAALVVILRTLLGSLFGGGVSGFLYSIAGGLLSTAMMSLLYHNFKKWFSLVTVSIVGAVFHNIGQISVAALVVNNLRLFYYLPVLLISAVITGLMIGLVVQYSIGPLQRILKLEGNR